MPPLDNLNHEAMAAILVTQETMEDAPVARDSTLNTEDQCWPRETALEPMKIDDDKGRFTQNCKFGIG
jgi:hypothetical protein